MNIFQKVKNGMMISGVFLILAGLVLLIFPEATTKTIAYLVAALLVLMGIAQIIGYFKNEPGIGKYSGGMVLGIFLLVVGLLVYYKSETIISIIPVILGVIILISGVAKLQQAIDLARMKMGSWSTVLVVALLNIVLGGVIIFNPFSTVMTLLRFVGVGLIYSGLSDIISTLYLSHRMKDYYDED